MKTLMTIVVFAASLSTQAAVIQSMNADCGAQKKGALWEVTQEAKVVPVRKVIPEKQPTQQVSGKVRTLGA